ncbi:SDR family oxidoreductase [Pseudomonas sp. Rh2]|uniref:UDP-glucose 4-epimerase family protein n=1 Tax=unclassified Pseudomonas TaxID=196821 RepID=UPI00345C81F7
MLDKPCKVMVTGASGFVGGYLLKYLQSQNDFTTVACVRRWPVKGPVMENSVLIGEVDGQTNWEEALAGVDVVIHVAARAHIVREDASDSLDLYRQVNVAGTLNLARQAAGAGVKRFIFISSIGVNGNGNSRPYLFSDPPNPCEPYALSKWEAEQGLWSVQKDSGIEVVIIRPPLVYGRGAPGNFGRLVGLIGKGVPLPLGAVRNRRTMIGVDNLVDLIVRCIEHPAAANQVLLAGDDEDLSTTDLLREVAIAMKKPLILVPLPQQILRFLFVVLGKRSMAQRLLGSLQVDISRTCELLDWRPPYSVKESLRRCFFD